MFRSSLKVDGIIRNKKQVLNTKRQEMRKMRHKMKFCHRLQSKSGTQGNNTHLRIEFILGFFLSLKYYLHHNTFKRKQKFFLLKVCPLLIEKFQFPSLAKCLHLFPLIYWSETIWSGNRTDQYGFSNNKYKCNLQ